MSRRRRTRTGAPGSNPAVGATVADTVDEDPRATADRERELLHERALAVREYRMGRASRPDAAAAGSDVRAETRADGTVATSVPINGMTCRACEVRINRYVGRIPGVERVAASAARGRVEIESRTRLSHADLVAAIAKAGYEIGRTPWLAREAGVWATAAAGVALVAVLALLAQVLGLAGLANDAGDLAQGGLVVALLLGLAAGVSTCMALVGGLVLGLSAAYRQSRAEAPTASSMRPALVFVGGRIAGYAAFGAGLGALGASVAMPPQLTAALMLAVAIVMALLGTRLTGISPRLAGWSPTLPLGVGQRLGLSPGGAAAYSDTRAAAFGALSFFLPCGFTQAIQVYALSTGSPLFAAALLGTFAIGTAPGLLALAGVPLVVPSRARPTLLRLVGVVVLAFAVVNGSAGLRLSGLTIPSFVGLANAAPPAGTLGADGVQSITTYQDADGYRPGNVVIYAGYPTRWTIQSSTTATCAASLWAPGVDVRMRLNKGPNVVDLPPLPVGVLDYTCSMGMYGGRITVVDRPVAEGPVATPRPTSAGAAASTPSAAAASPAPAGSVLPAAPAASLPSVQELRTYQDWDGYGPQGATIYAGIPTRWSIESRSSVSCAAFIVVPSLDIQRYLVAGDENVIDLPALPAGRLDYTCSMGMYWGSIAIVEPPRS